MEITSPEIFETYMRNLTGCADRYRSGKIAGVQSSLRRI